MRYRLKLMITISLLIALSFGIGGTVMLTASFQSSLKQETEKALESFEVTQGTLSFLNTVNQSTDLDGLAQTLSQIAEQNLGHWEALTLTTEDNIIFQDGILKKLDYTLPAPGTDQCSLLFVEDGFGQGILFLSNLTADDITMELTARFDVSAVYETRRSQQMLYTSVYFFVVCLGILAAVILSYLLTRPMQKLTKTVRLISGGDLTQRSGLKSQDEIGQLSRDFDTMADKLQDTINRLEADIQRQESFMGAFSHELKTPMTSIIGFADLLRQGNMDENSRMMAAEYIYSEGHRLERLSFKLLELLLLKTDEIAFKQISMEDFIAEIEHSLMPVLQEKRIQFVCRSQQGIVSLEPDLVKSLLYNLIDNASKAIDRDGIITLQASILPGGCQLQVTDNGRGMEQQELSKITEAFYRVDKARSRSQGGAGLGLALCQQIVSLHKGELHFTSKPGQGTCVTTTLYGEKVSEHE